MSVRPIVTRRMARIAPRSGRDQRIDLTKLRRVLEVVKTDVVEWPTTRSLPPVKARVPTELLRVEPGSASQWRAIVPARQHRDVETFLRRGDVGYLATVGGEFAGWVWMSRQTHRDPWSGLTIRLADDEAYSYALWVKEDLRPQGIAAVLMTAILKEAKEAGNIARVYGWVDQHNRQSAFLLRIVFGFAHVQSLQRLHLARRWGGQVPFSARPAFGPLSRAGHHAAEAQRDRL